MPATTDTFGADNGPIFSTHSMLGGTTMSNLAVTLPIKPGDSLMRSSPPTTPTTLLSTSAALPETIQIALKNFTSHSLNDLKNASLMNRVDTKFIVPIHALEHLLNTLPSSYSALEINGQKSFQYVSTYFDTEDYLFYRMHHGGKLNRHKVRVRHYVDSDTHYLEVKLKNNKKRTLKQRIEIASSTDYDLKAHQDFLQRLQVPQAQTLQASLINSYQRIALASELRGERLTIDLNLCNQALTPNLSHEWPTQVHLSHFAVVELKQASLNRSSPFFELVRKMGIRPSGFSKYCLGMAFTQTHEAIKHNHFKPIVRRIERLYQTPTTSEDLCLV
jgi:VTC domain